MIITMMFYGNAIEQVKNSLLIKKRKLMFAIIPDAHKQTNKQTDSLKSLGGGAVMITIVGLC